MYDLRLFRLFCGDSSGMYRSLQGDGVKGDPSPTWKYREDDEEEAVTKTAIKELQIFVS